MTSSRVVMSPAGLQAFYRSSDVRVFMEWLGKEIALDAAELAPRRTGALADSIGYELGFTDAGVPQVSVSYDEDHWYGIFAEVGTSEVPAQPYLRPALEKHRTI